jgi:predicted aspartyl protease
LFRTTTRCLSFLILLAAFHLTRIGSMDASAHANVSLRMLNGNLPVACVSINGRAPVEFVIDTGTNTTLIDPGLAVRLQLKPAGRKTLTTLSGPLTTRRYLLDTISIGGETRSGPEALEQPLTQLQRFDPDIQGIIGFDFLSAFSFRIDYERARLDLYAAGEVPEIAGGVRVPLRIVDDHILVRVVSADADQGSWFLALDSGVSQLLIFENRLALRESVVASKSSVRGTASNSFAADRTRQVATNLSSTTARAITLDEISIGNLNLERVPTVSLPAPPAALAVSEDGLLPACMFNAVFVDRVNGTVIFDPD